MSGRPKSKTSGKSTVLKAKTKSRTLPTGIFVILPVALAVLVGWYLDIASQVFGKEDLYDPEIERDRTIFDVVEIPGRGKGLVANRDIQAGELVIIEKPILLVNTEISKTYLHDTYANWTQGQKDAFHSLTYSQLPDGIESIDPNLATQSKEDHVALMEAIIRNNGVGLALGLLGVFPRMARMNHACVHFHMRYQWWDKEKELRVYAFRDVKKGEELLTSYISPLKTKKDRMEHLRSAYGFDCNCPTCTLSGEESRKSDSRLLEIKNVYRKFTRWNEGEIDGVEAIDLVHQYWGLSIEEGYWNDRGQIAEEAAYVAAAHGDIEAAREWARLAYYWSSREWGSDSERAVRTRQIIANPKSHHMWGVKAKVEVGGPFSAEKDHTR